MDGMTQDELSEGIEEQIRNIVSQVKKVPNTLYEDTMGFFHAINWTEPLLIGIIVFHIIVFVLAYTTRHSSVSQTLLFLLILSTVLCTEYFNIWASQNWRLFATQNYFDSGGFFITAVFSFPLLFAMIFQLVLILSQSVMLMKELRQKKLKIKKNATSDVKSNIIFTPSTAALVAEGEITVDEAIKRDERIKAEEAKEIEQEEKETVIALANAEKAVLEAAKAASVPRTASAASAGSEGGSELTKRKGKGATNPKK